MTDHSAEMHDCIDEVETVVLNFFVENFLHTSVELPIVVVPSDMFTPSIATTISASTHHSDLTYKTPSVVNVNKDIFLSRNRCPYTTLSPFD